MTDARSAPTNDEEAPPPPSEDDWGLDEGEFDHEVVEKLPRPPV
jgi:hypothetical protein